MNAMDLVDYDISLEKQLKFLLRQQETLEERIIVQRAAMRDISDRFTVLRERATRSAHSELSLHDLLVMAAYSNTQHSASTSEAMDRATCKPKETYDVFIRSRVLDESCALPDCATQFHSLTADSLYLLIPHLTNLLNELTGQSQQQVAAAAATASLSSIPHSITVNNAGAADVESSAWIARVLWYLELSVRDFPEVLENSEHLPKLQESLAHLWNQQTVVTELRRRARQLVQQMKRRQTDELIHHKERSVLGLCDGNRFLSSEPRMIQLLVDGDYLLSGMTPSGDNVIRQTVEHLLDVIETKLSSSSSSGTVGIRIALFSSSILKSVGEEQREFLISCLRRLRFQTIVLDSIPNRAGSPIDAAMCTRTMSIITKPSTNKYVLVYFTANAYISSALEWAQGAGSDIYFVVYDGDMVADVLLAYASGSDVATIPKGEGVKCMPELEAVSAALAALQTDGADLSLSVLQQLRQLQNKAHSDAGKGNASSPFTPPPAIAGVPNPFESPAADSAQDGAGGEAAERAFPNALLPTAPPANSAKDSEEELAAVSARPQEAHVVTTASAAPVTVAVAAQGKPQAATAPDGLPEPMVSTRLPVGWGLMYDRSRRRHYFVHAETGRTAWAHPGGAAEQMDLERQVEEWYTKQQKQRQSESAVAPPASAHTAAAQGWEECIDAKSGRKYYVHRQSKQTSWTLPNSIPVVNPTIQMAPKVLVGSALPPHWEERVDTKSGRKFYVNHQTHETTWVAPQSTQAAVQPTPASSNATEALPPNWEERTDAHTGKKYYINHQSRETTWTRPGGALPARTQEPLPLPLPPSWEERVDPRTVAFKQSMQAVEERVVHPADVPLDSELDPNDSRKFASGSLATSPVAEFHSADTAVPAAQPSPHGDFASDAAEHTPRDSTAPPVNTEGSPLAPSVDGFSPRPPKKAEKPQRPALLPSRVRQGPSQPSPYVPSSRANGNGDGRNANNKRSENYWFPKVTTREIGAGTVGLFTSGPPPPLHYGTAAERFRRAAAYVAWREQHSDLFRALHSRGAAGRAAQRERRQRGEARQREARDEAYADEVTRLRRRGWSVLGGAPRPASAARYGARRAERAAARAERAAAEERRAHDGAQLRDEIARQVAERRAEDAARAKAVRRAAAAERLLPRELAEGTRLARAQQRAAEVRAENEARRAAAAEERAAELQSLRESHVLTLTNRSSAQGSSPSSEFQSLRGTTTSRSDWNSTFRSPLPLLPNASDDAYRKKWLRELQGVRLNSARAEVAHIRAWEKGAEAARGEALRENCERADELRAESDALRDRRCQLEEEAAAANAAARLEEMIARQRRRDLFGTLREERKQRAAQQRRAVEDEEALAKTWGEEDLQELRSRIARRKSPHDRKESPKSETVS